MDEVGFAAVGSGAQQAEAYLMLSRYTPDRDFNYATLAAYSAKRQAENAPYVGPGTDLMRIDSGGVGVAAPQNFIDWERIYKKRLRSELRANERAHVEMEKYMEALTATAEPPATQAQTPKAAVTDKQKRVRRRPAKGKPDA